MYYQNENGPDSLRPWGKIWNFFKSNINRKICKIAGFDALLGTRKKMREPISTAFVRYKKN